jgi:hypothetical protein
MLWRFTRAAAIGGAAAFLAACATPQPAAQAPVTPAIAVTTDMLTGEWGVASYQDEADRGRATAAAKAACSQPYEVSAGSDGGVIMHLPDQTIPQEVFLKTGPDGTVYIGQQGPPGQWSDRRVLSASDALLVTRFVDASAAARYGTMIFAKCRGSA